VSAAGVGEVVAVFGGDGRFDERAIPGCQVRKFLSRRAGGNGELRRLEAALRAGSIHRVVVLSRWNGHSGTQRVARLCRKLGIPVEVWR